jgi:hypothetical protein
MYRAARGAPQIAANAAGATAACAYTALTRALWDRRRSRRRATPAARDRSAGWYKRVGLWATLQPLRALQPRAVDEFPAGDDSVCSYSFFAALFGPILFSSIAFTWFAEVMRTSPVVRETDILSVQQW